MSDDASPSDDSGIGFPRWSCDGAFFCSDFERDPFAPFGWGRVGPSGSAVDLFALRDDTSVSSSHSLHVVSGVNGLEEWVEASTKDADGGLEDPAHGRIRAAMRIDAVPGGGGAQASAIMLNCASGGDAATVKVLPDGSVGLGKQQADAVAMTGPVLHQWLAVDLTFTKAGQTVDSELVVTGPAGPTTSTISFGNCDPELKIRVGLRLFAPAAYDLSFDDVVVDLSL